MATVFCFVLQFFNHSAKLERSAITWLNCCTKADVFVQRACFSISSAAGDRTTFRIPIAPKGILSSSARTMYDALEFTLPLSFVYRATQACRLVTECLGRRWASVDNTLRGSMGKVGLCRLFAWHYCLGAVLLSLT
jgi:hypothetical protein